MSRQKEKSLLRGFQEQHLRRERREREGRLKKKERQGAYKSCQKLPWLRKFLNLRCGREKKKKPKKRSLLVIASCSTRWRRGNERGWDRRQGMHACECSEATRTHATRDTQTRKHTAQSSQAEEAAEVARHQLRKAGSRRNPAEAHFLIREIG